MAKKRNPHPILTPRFIGGVVITRIPQHTDEATRAKVLALSKQIAYDHSEHPEVWQPQYYKKRSWQR